MKIPGILLLCLLLFGAFGCENILEKRSKYLERGREYYASGNLEKARIEIKNLLKIDSDSSKAHNLYAQIQEKRKKFKIALAHYLKATRLDPNDPDAKYRLAKLYLLLGESEETLRLANSLLQSEPDNPDAKVLRIASLARVETPAIAIVEGEKLLRSHPEKEIAALLLARLYREENRTQDAVEALENALPSHPDSISIRVMLADIYLQKKKLPDVERLLREVIAIRPENNAVQLQLVRLYASQEKYENAYAVLDQSVQQTADDHESKLYLIDLLHAWKGPGAAKNKLRRYISEFPDTPILNLKFASLHEKTQEFDKAQALYLDTIDKAGDRPIALQAKNMLARLLLAQKDIKYSNLLTQEVLKNNPKDLSALSIAAEIALLQRDFTTGITHIRTILDETPDSTEMLLMLAKAHDLNHEPALSLEALRKAVALAPKNRKIRLALTDYHVNRKQFSRALEQLDVLLTLSPDDLYSVDLKAKVLLATGKIDSAFEHIDKYVKLHAGDFRLHMQLAKIYSIQKDTHLAIKAYERVIQLQPRYYEAYLGLTEAYLQSKKTTDIHYRLTQLVNSNVGEYAELLLGKVASYQNDIVVAQRHYRNALDKNPQWAQAYLALGAAQIKSGDFARAVTTYQRGLENLPADPSLSIALAVGYSNANEIDNAINQYERILKVSPDNSVAANNLAVLLSEKKGDEESLKQALGLTQILATAGNPAFLDTLGWIHYKLDDMKQAIPLLEEAVYKSPATPIYSYHLGMAYHKDQRNTLATKYLENSLSKNIDFVGADFARKVLEQQ